MVYKCSINKHIQNIFENDFQQLLYSFYNILPDLTINFYLIIFVFYMWYTNNSSFDGEVDFYAQIRLKIR